MRSARIMRRERSSDFAHAPLGRRILGRGACSNSLCPGLTPQVGFTRLAALHMQNSGKPEFCGIHRKEALHPYRWIAGSSPAMTARSQRQEPLSSRRGELLVLGLGALQRRARRKPIGVSNELGALGQELE